ncbi:MAG: asparagine synthase (glutamine-hydrolyzing) [Lentisphaeria bacterium]|nr:asparagine synthase (glutamine-hydrolyzing) [Lentisphaeria bacterium]
MCGIAGIFNCREKIDASEILNAMCGALYHRGPDGYGRYTAPGAALGHRRLAVIDLETGAQPLYSEDKSLVLVINGEIYNFMELRRELESKGHTFSSRSDSEVLLHLYEEYGKNFLPRLDGMFAFALYDSRKKKLLLGRDPMGKKPLYYFIRQKELAFASELGALKCHPGFPGALDHDALADYFSLLYIPPPGTVYKEVFQLPPAHFMEFDCAAGHGEIKPYWQIDFSQKLKGSREELAAELRRLVFQAVEKRLVADVPAGVFLSGGIDSNITAAVTARLLKGGKCCACTVGFGEARYDERVLAAKGAAFINAQCGGVLQHKVQEVESGDFSLVEELTAHCGQPYADSSILPTALLSAFARREITVALSGDGADELFGGYERYLAMELARKFTRIPETLRRGALKALSFFPEGGERSFAGRLARFLRISCVPEAERYFAIIDRAPQNLRRRLFTDDFYSSLSASGPERFLRHQGDLTTLCRGESYSETDIATYLPGDILPKADISSMASALEVRSPFLDRDVVRFAAALPWEMKLRNRERKSLLKYAFADLLAPEVLHAPKRGFGVPVASLLRNKWRKAAEELLFAETPGQREILRIQSVEQLWKEHLSARRDHSYILWSIIIFALFMKR